MTTNPTPTAPVSPPQPWEGHDDPPGALFALDVSSEHFNGTYGPFPTRRAAWETYTAVSAGLRESTGQVHRIMPPSVLANPSWMAAHGFEIRDDHPGGDSHTFVFWSNLSRAMRAHGLLPFGTRV